MLLNNLKGIDMKLIYKGAESPILLENKDGKLVSVEKGSSFECGEAYGNDLLEKFNEAGRHPKFVVSDEVPDTNKMATPGKKKAEAKEEVTADPII